MLALFFFFFLIIFVAYSALLQYSYSSLFIISFISFFLPHPSTSPSFTAKLLLKNLLLFQNYIKF